MTLDDLSLQRWEDEGGAFAMQMNTPQNGPLSPLAHGTIYDALADHQVKEEWDTRHLLAWLHQWAAIFIFEFKLQVSTFALSADWLRTNCFGHFRKGHNGFGLKGEIAINLAHFDRTPEENLGTLLHELLHAEQEEQGTPGKNNYHNVEFRRRAAEFGLIVDETGRTKYAAESPFKTLLQATGVLLPPAPPVECRKNRPGSKLKLWMCACKTRARVGVTDFRVLCLKCNTPFELQEGAADKRTVKSKAA